jgi:hypothetical protein
MTTNRPKANAMKKSVERMCYEALVALVKRYVGLVESGDAGFWDPEKEHEVIYARASIAAYEAKQAARKSRAK